MGIETKPKEEYYGEWSIYADRNSTTKIVLWLERRKEGRKERKCILLQQKEEKFFSIFCQNFFPNKIQQQKEKNEMWPRWGMLSTFSIADFTGNFFEWPKLFRKTPQ